MGDCFIFLVFRENITWGSWGSPGRPGGDPLGSESNPSRIWVESDLGGSTPIRLGFDPDSTRTLAAHPERSRENLGVILSHLGVPPYSGCNHANLFLFRHDALLGHLGAILGYLGPSWDDPARLVGPSDWDPDLIEFPHEPPSGHHGASLGSSWVMLGPSWPPDLSCCRLGCGTHFFVIPWGFWLIYLEIRET